MSVGEVAEVLGSLVNTHKHLMLSSASLGDLVGHCRLHSRFGGVRTVLVQLADADVPCLFQLGKVRSRWVNCRI